MAQLTFVLEHGQEVVIPLEDATSLTLGRGDDNDVVVDDARISPHHATLALNDDGSLEVRDLGSAVGTFVNGERVQNRHVHHGDTVAFGPLTARVDLKQPMGRAAASARTSGEDATSQNTRRAPSSARRFSSKNAHAHAHSNGNNSNGTHPAQPDPRDQEMAAILQRLNAEKLRLQQEVEALQTQASQHQLRKQEREREVTAMQAKVQSWQERASREMREHSTRMDTLHADEKRLAHVSTAVQEAQALHEQWVEAVRTISTEHQDKDTDLRRLIAAEEAARHEISSLATHRDQELAHLQQVREECARDEAHLDTLRQQIATQEQRHKRVEDLANAREDQLQLAEKKLADIANRRTRLEAQVKELASAEENLSQAQSLHQATRAAVTMLEAQKQELETSVQGLASRLAATQAEHAEAADSLEETRATHRQAEEALRGVHAEIKTRQAELATETTRLQEASTRRAEIITQCEELADTQQELATVSATLAEAEQRQQHLQADITAKEARIAEVEASVTALVAKEDSAKGRLEVLHGRENDLRSELGKLATSEHSTRVRFEEIRQLLTEAEQEHEARTEEHTTRLKAAQQELHELESKLIPLRDWKEAMDQLYARLAALPEGSQEARDLWQEIEKEKADLTQLISTARSQAQGTTTPRGKKAAKTSDPQEKETPAAVPAFGPEPPRANGPHASAIANALANGSGGASSNGSSNSNSNGASHNHGLAMATVQERTLNSRLHHLRESVQREESRLEFLRQERGRQETRLRSGSGAASAAHQREHDRHLESKIRHDEEQLTALHQHLEQARAEEEKRRAKIVEMEHKLAELHTGITEAERHRSDLRHQADLAHTELKNFESTHDRLKKAAAEEAAMQKEMATAWGPPSRFDC